MIRAFTAGLLTGYVATGILFAFAAPKMPALNWKGRTYYAAVWPAWPLSVTLNRLIVPIPAWSFTFEEPAK